MSFFKRITGAGGSFSVAAIAGEPDASEPGPPAWIERTTLLGEARLKALPWTDAAIFDAKLTVARQDEGCVRFSFVARDFRTPRRYRCQPDLEIQREIDGREQATGAKLPEAARKAIAARVQDWLKADHGPRLRPAGLRPVAPRLSGPDPHRGRGRLRDGGLLASEKEPQRLANLSLSLQEYLPFGLDGAAILVT